MMELLRSWLLGVTAAALLCALADSLMPPGAVRRVGKLACGLLLLAAVLRPLTGAEGAFSAAGLGEWAGTPEQQNLKDAQDAVLQPIIEDACAAYIVDKAAEFGAECTARVTCSAGENGVFFPEAVTVTGTLTGDQHERLAQAIEDGLGIVRENQSFLEAKEESP